MLVNIYYLQCFPGPQEVSVRRKTNIWYVFQNIVLELKFTPKRAQILSKLKLQQIVVISQLYTKINNFDKISYKYLVNTLLKPKE